MSGMRQRALSLILGSLHKSRETGLMFTFLQLRKPKHRGDQPAPSHTGGGTGLRKVSIRET